MNAADDYQFDTNRKDLAAGILKQAALDLRRFHGATSGVCDFLSLRKTTAVQQFFNFSEMSFLKA